MAPGARADDGEAASGLRDRWVGLGLGVLICALAAWQFQGLGASWTAPIPHGVNEDWDWQLTAWELGRRAMLDGQWPEWNAFTQGGQPLFANPETPYLYPGFLALLPWPTEQAMRMLLLAHLWLMVWGFYALGRSWGLRPWSAHAASVLLLCSAFLPEFMAWGHVMFLPLGWLPLALVASHRGRWWLAGLCLAMPALAGGHYLAIYGVLLLLADGVARSLEAGRLRWLALGLAANGLLLGLPAWTMAPVLLGALLVQKVGRHEGWRLLGTLAVAALLTAPKWLTLLLVAEHLQRFGQVHGAVIADVYSVDMAVDVLRGALDRPSGHEGQNVFWTAVPLLGLPGLLWAGWRRPAMAAPLWLFWCLGWAGATPLNLWAPIHELPGLSSLRVVERFSLLWTPALGYGLGLLADRVRFGGAALGALLVWQVWVGAPQAAGLQRKGPGPEAVLPVGDFVQTRDELTNLQALRANRAKVDCTSAAGLAEPAPVRAVTDPGYRGEAWTSSGPQDLRVQGDRLLSVPGATVNQSWLPGWPGEPSPEGFVQLPEGQAEYRAPGLRPGLGLMLLPLLGPPLALRR